MKYQFTSVRKFSSIQFSRSVVSDFLQPQRVDCSTPGLPVHHQFPEFTQVHVHWVGDAIQPSNPPLSPSPPAFNFSQHQDLFKWVHSGRLLPKIGIWVLAGMWRNWNLCALLGKIEGDRRRGRQKVRWLDGITDSMDMNLGRLREIVRDRQAWRASVHGLAKSWTRLSNWTTTKSLKCNSK